MALVALGNALTAPRYLTPINEKKNIFAGAAVACPVPIFLASVHERAKQSMPR